MIVMMLFCSLSVAIMLINAKKNFIDTIHKQQIAFSKFISISIDIEINKGLDFFTDLANNISDQPLEKIVLNDGMLIPPIFKQGIIIIASDGKSLINEIPIVPGRKNLSFVQSDWFQRARLADKAIVSKPFRNRITQKPSIVFAAPLRNSLNELIGVVAGSLELNHPDFLKQLYALKIGMNGGILVVSPEDKLFVASNKPEMVLMPTPIPGINPLHDMAMNGYRGVGQTRNAYGIEELSAITSVKSTGWFTVVRLPLKEALLSARHLAKFLIVYNVLLIIAVVLIIGCVLIFMLAPLKKSAESVKKMALGDHVLEKLPVIYKDEVGDLIEGFNSLVDAIDERTDELEMANQKLAALSITDELTGLGNRRHFNEKLVQEWSRASRTQQPLALAMIDVDWFKKYNDHYGHQMGDECLKNVANVLASIINRTGDVVARYGGEEFAVIAPDTTAEGAQVIAEKFRMSLQLHALPHAESKLGCVTASIGVATAIPTKGESPISLIKIVDKALYRAKEEGRNRVVLSSNSIDIDSVYERD